MPFTVIPVNGQVFDWEHLMRSMTTYMGDMFVIAFRIILPVFACIMILNCILGIMAKVSPQMNMFAVGMQMKTTERHSMPCTRYEQSFGSDSSGK